MERSREVDEALRGLHAVAQSPFSAADTIPPLLYRSRDVEALEMERIFSKDWVCPGLAADLPKPGDYITFSIGDQPVLTLRGRDGVIRSFSNVCLHRMMPLVEGRGSCGNKMVCPYHAWTYDTEGKVIGAGHMGGRDPAFDKKQFRLPELRTEIWQGWVYVTLNPDAPSVAELLQGLLPVVERYDMAGYIPVVHQDHVWDTNWKLLNENFMEGYHLPVAHKATVGAWFPVEDTEFPDEVFDAFTYQTFTKDENATYGRAHESNTRLEGKWRYTSILPTVFPTHMYVLAPDHLWYLSLRPKGVGQVHVRFGVALAPEVHEALGETRDQWVKELVDFFDRVNAEDKFVVEGIFKGSKAPLASRGPLSWLEREIHDFARYLDKKLNGPAVSEKRIAAE
ncbi:aromatic ring-hydroxylating oxygenase subunit alpha [Aestuariivirga sp.]|uniref:aromatic ring-hydroxylating oxygenase subunit alpha n=1 Tax=Aestuariivirga sp. TaxID=2650926 RepID=UPI0039E2A7D3